MRIIDFENAKMMEQRIDNLFVNENYHETEEWIDTANAIEILGVSSKFLYYHSSAGNIGYSIFGTKKYFLKKEIETLKYQLEQ